MVNPDTSTQVFIHIEICEDARGAHPQKGMIGREQHLFARIPPVCESEHMREFKIFTMLFSILVAVLHLGYNSPAL